MIKCWDCISTVESAPRVSGVHLCAGVASTTGNSLDGGTVLNTTPALQTNAVNMFYTFLVQNLLVYLLDGDPHCGANGSYC